MAYLVATDKPVYWSAAIGGNIIHSEITEAGGKTGIPPAFTVASATDENTFLGLVASSAGTYKPLPIAGTWMEAGQIYGYNSGLVIIRQSHTRTEHKPEDIPALISVYRPAAGTLDWVANEKVYKGVRRMFLTKEYECILDHVTQVDWTPDKTPTLWKLYVVVIPEAPWDYPVAYKVSDIVTYLGSRYQCLQAHTSIVTWTPNVVPALWKKL